MSQSKGLQDELDEYENQLGRIAEILLDQQLQPERQIREIEAVVFPEDDLEEDKWVQ